MRHGVREEHEVHWGPVLVVPLHGAVLKYMYIIMYVSNILNTMCVYIYIYVYTHVYIYIYIYIYRERERNQ